MELNWSTFILEIINFLILVWILKRFFYLPVMNAIEKRRKSIEDSMTQAEATRAEAKQIEDKYQARLTQWEEEKKLAHEKLHKEINEERTRLMEALLASIEKERDKAKVLAERNLIEERRKNEQYALNNAAQFTSHLLKRLAGPELENKLCQLLLNELPNLAPERLETLRNVFTPKAGAVEQTPVKVTSAYTLDDACRNTIQNALSGLVNQPIQCSFAEDPRLIAGLRINMGPLVLRANLHDELQLFTESQHGSS